MLEKLIVAAIALPIVVWMLATVARDGWPLLPAPAQRVVLKVADAIMVCGLALLACGFALLACVLWPILDCNEECDQ